MDPSSASSDARHPDRATDVTGQIEVRYWAAARAAAGVQTEQVASDRPLTLATLVSELTGRHPGTRLDEVLHVCSVLRDGTQVGNRDPATVEVRPGQSVEFLPPFAGG